MVTNERKGSKGPPVPGLPDWTRARDYCHLLLADRRYFAWEWLRRSPHYRSAWQNRSPRCDHNAIRFGLLRLVDPALSSSIARPIWRRDADPAVLETRALTRTVVARDRLDIRELAPYVSVATSDNMEEHWLVSNGQWSIRLDVHNGTLLGGPTLLEHSFYGMQSALPAVTAFRQLVALAATGTMPIGLAPHERKAPRWIMELRTADALACGATQQDIARSLFGRAVSPTRWRNESPSYRSRVQRLVRIARARLGAPLDGPWFM